MVLALVVWPGAIARHPVLIGWPVTAQAATAAADPEADRALSQVNAYRTAAGLPELAFHGALAAAADAHARYLSRHRLQQHHETPGTAGFTGANALERARRFGYDGGVTEVIAFLPTAEAAVTGWVDTLYHRLALLHPGVTEMGYGHSGDPFPVNVINAGPIRAAAATVAWPYPGQPDVPVGWHARESPDPLRLHPGVQGPVGYPITLTFAPAPRRLSLTRAELVGPDGAAVALLTFAPDTDEHLDDTVAVMPRQPLRPGTAYTVRLAGEIDRGRGSQPYHRSWTFTTATDVPLRLGPATEWSWQTRGGVLQTVEVRRAGLDDRVQAFLGGLPVRSLTAAGTDAISFVPPLGFRGAGGGNLLLVSPGGQELRLAGALPPGAVTDDDGQPPYTPARRTLHAAGRVLPVVVQVHIEGTVMVPTAALANLGAVALAVPGTGRTYWFSGGRQGAVTAGYTSATVDGTTWQMPLPVQSIAGVEHVAADFVATLLGVSGEALWSPPAPDPGVGAGPTDESGLTGASGLTDKSDLTDEADLVDVTGHWAEAAIRRLAAIGVVVGYPDGTFRPGETLSRAAFVKMLVAGAGLDLRPGDSGGYTDLMGHWLVRQGYLGAAVTAGIVPPATAAQLRFRPDQPIEREDIAVLAVRSLGLAPTAAADASADTSADTSAGAGMATGTAWTAGTTGIPGAAGGTIFADRSSWQHPDLVQIAVAKGLIQGYREPDGSFTFRPQSTATRAEAAVVMDRSLALHAD